MSQRSQVEDRFTVTCFICKIEWVYPSKLPNQRSGLCRECAKIRKTVIFKSGTAEYLALYEGISKTKFTEYHNRGGIIVDDLLSSNKK